MKSYEKPKIYFESYELSESIAACAWDMTAADSNNCQAVNDSGRWPNEFLFNNTGIDGNGPCTVTPDLIEDFCYTQSNSNNNTFNS